MEVTILQAHGIPANSVVSIRAGRTRRQALVTHKRPFRFPNLGLNASPVQIDVMTPVTSGHLDAISAAETHSVFFPTEPGKKPMSMTLQVRDVPKMCPSPDHVLRQMSSISRAGTTSACSDLPTRATSATGYASASNEPLVTLDRQILASVGARGSPSPLSTTNFGWDSGSAVIAACNYLERSNVLGFMQELLRYIVREMPEDPVRFMADHLAGKVAPVPKALGAEAIDGYALSANVDISDEQKAEGKAPVIQAGDTNLKAQHAELGKWLDVENIRLRRDIRRLEEVCKDEGMVDIAPRTLPPLDVGTVKFEQLKAQHVEMTSSLMALCEDAIMYASRIRRQVNAAPPTPVVQRRRRTRVQRISTNRGLLDGADDVSDSELEDEPKYFLRPRSLAVSAESYGAWNVRLSECALDKFEKSLEDYELIRQTLRNSPIFANLDNEGVKPIIDQMPLVTFEAAEVMMRQGHAGDHMLVVLSGSIGCYSDVGARKVLVSNVGPGRTVGELSMLWQTPRALTLVATERCVCGQISRKVYQDYVVRREVNTFDMRVRCLRNTSILEGLSDEQIAQLADIAETFEYDAGEVIIYQGDVGTNFFVLLSGECVATRTEGDAGHQDVQEHRRYSAGDFFGERALLMENPIRAASVSTTRWSEVMCLSRSGFERLIGPFNQLRAEIYLADPRTSIAAFYKSGNELGPAGAGGDPTQGKRRTDWFSVYRPTSREAIAKMLGGRAVGKGLNVKGKSAKCNRLAGLVPFLQISENKHKDKIENPPGDASIDVFWQSDSARRQVQIHLQALLDDPDIIAEIEDPHLVELNSYPEVFGFRIPEALIHKAFIEGPDLSFPVGWETGRKSEPAFMDMNLNVLRNKKTWPPVVLYQANLEDPMCPHGLVMSYAEATVKPVVSDFDTFLVGSRGMTYDPLPPDQIELAKWMLDRTRDILKQPDSHSWTTRWLEVLKEAVIEGRQFSIPTSGLGDATSIHLIEKAMEATRDYGAVRHGAECFNFIFPQELDTEYLVVWDGFELASGKAWDYMDEDELRAFLIERVDNGYSFPLNPVWLVRDLGWYEVLEALMASQESANVIPSWYPAESGLLEQIQAIHDECPEGFMPEFQDGHGPVRNKSMFGDLDACEKADLALDTVRRTALLHKFRHASKAFLGLGIAKKIRTSMLAQERERMSMPAKELSERRSDFENSIPESSVEEKKPDGET